MFDRILFALDFSERSLRTFDSLLEHHELGAKEVIITHVTRPDGTLTAERREALDIMHWRLAQTGVGSREIIAHGEPVAEILRAERQENVDLIVMASSGKGRAQELFVGSTSMGVLRSADRPVLLFKSLDHGPLLEGALVPLDLSSCPEIVDRAVPALIEAGLRKAVLLHVIPSTHYSMDDDQRFGHVADMLDRQRDKLAGAGCEVDTHIHFGTVSYNILEAAGELRSSIIVLGIHRRSLLREVALGGNAEEVIRRSPLPLLVVPCER